MSDDPDISTAAPRQVIVTTADVHEMPDTHLPRGKMETQLIYGETFKVETEASGWCRGYCAHDGYPGWVHSSHLRPVALASTHIVTAARSHAYAGPTIKTALVQTFSFGSKVRIVDEGEKFAQLEDGSWIYRAHLTPRAELDTDYVATAMKFLETPYYWGGRSGFGIDCSGLVQVCLGRAGIKADRDTELQTGTIGTTAESAPEWGDFVFFPGHVGIMIDDKNIIHATGFHMKVCIEPLEEVAHRSNGVTAVRRLMAKEIRGETEKAPLAEPTLK
jgi:cell wall-associated NlpC family hydrolase